MQCLKAARSWKIVRGTASAIAALLAGGCVQILGIEDKPLNEGGGGADGAPSTGTCDGEIHVRIMANETGRTAAVDNPKTAAIVDVFEALNAEGGIRGCTINYGEVGDAEYLAENATAVYSSWREAPQFDEVSTIFVNGTPIMKAIARATEEDNKVLMGTSFSADFAAPEPLSHEVAIPLLRNDDFELVYRNAVQKTSDGWPFVFYQGTDYSSASRAGMSFLVSKNLNSPGSARRVGFFYDFESGYAAPPVDAAKTYLIEQGISENQLPVDLGRELDVSMSLSETTVEGLRDAVIEYFTAEYQHREEVPDYTMVDWIWFGNTRDTATVMCQAMKLVGDYFKDSPLEGIDTSDFKIRFLTNNWAVDEQFHDDTNGACSGDWWTVQPFALYGDTSAIGMRELTQIHDTRRAQAGHLRGEEYPVVSYVVGYVAARVWQRAVEDVIDADKPVTGQALREALESLENVSVSDLTAGPIGYRPSDHRPQQRVYIYHLEASGNLRKDGFPVDVPLRGEWLGW